MSANKLPPGMARVNAMPDTFHMMSIDDLARALNQSTWRTWRLIWALKPVMKTLCASGPGEPFRFKPQAVDLLKRAQALRKSGVSIKKLDSALRRHLFENINLAIANPSLN